MKIHVLIMAGGNGTRFWPVSTPKKPKQYTNLASEDTLIQQSIKRSLHFSKSENIHVVTVQGQKNLALQQTSELIPDSNIIIEPEGRNTAPCIFLGVLEILKKGFSDSDCVVVLPSDHVINNHENFSSDILTAVENAQSRKTITVVGIEPITPHTGYGYIKKGGKLSENLNQVEQFVEKPVLEVAQKYLKSGNYFWNAGMFISRIDTLIQEIMSHAPELGNFREMLLAAVGDFAQVQHVYSQLPKESIDYAVIEKSQKVDVVASSFDWSDLGSWDALEDIVKKEKNNIICTANKTQFLESEGNIVYAPGKKVSLVNCNNLVIVAEGDHIMVLPKEDSQRVKQLDQEI